MKTKCFFKILISIISILTSFSVYSKGARMLTSDNELSSSLITDIYIDKNNNVWIATENGLNRYDGSKVTVYQSDSSKDGAIAHNNVKFVSEDSKGHIYVGTYHGLQLYDPQTDTFSPLLQEKGATEIKTTNMQSASITDNGDFLVAGNALYRVLLESNSELEAIKIKGLTAMEFSAMHYDKNGNLWLANNEGIYRIDNTKNLTFYPYTPTMSGIDVFASDNNGSLYAGTATHGLFRFDKEDQNFHSVDLGTKNPGDLKIRSLYFDGENNLLIGTDGYGLMSYDTKSAKLTQFRLDVVGLKDDETKIHKIVRDNFGNLWIGVFQKGILMVPATSDAFKYIGAKSQTNNVIGEKGMTAVCFNTNTKHFYIGTDGDGIYELDEKLQPVAHYGRNSGVPPIVTSLFFNSDDNSLLIGAFGEKGYRLNTTTGVVSPLNSAEKINNIYDFSMAPDGNIFIATMGAGLFKYDRTTNQITKDEKVGPMIKSDWIDCLHYSPKGKKLYAGTYNGLFEVDLSADNKGMKHVIPAQIIYCIHEDNEGRIWVGTPGALICYNPENAEVSTITQHNGLASNTIYSILEDKTGHLWLGTSHGLTRYDKNSRHAVNYFASDGLQGNEFLRNSSFMTPSGYMVFGGINGVTYFEPSEIHPNDKKWDVKISDLYINSESVTPQTRSNGTQITKLPVSESSEFIFDWRSNSFTLEFATTDFAAPEGLEYMYRLDGDGWVTLPADQHLLSISHLSPGSHTLEYKVKDNMVESDPKTLSIYVTIPWYRSWIAICIYILLAIGIVILSLAAIHRHYKSQQEFLRHKQNEELNEQKLNFLINIAHEIRTPLSLIISPLQKLLKMDTGNEEQHYHRTMMRNANRMLRLVNELLDLRNIEAGKLKVECTESNLDDFVELSISNFEHIAASKNITLIFHQTNEDLMVWIDPVQFEKVIDNLMLNAIKFTPADGQIDVIVSKTDGKAQIEVRDTGIGIPTEQLEKIFDRFHQVNSPEREAIPGNGIGLNLTRSIVNLHHGEIRALPGIDGTGSRFIVQIPLGCSHLNSNEIAKNQTETTEKYDIQDSFEDTEKPIDKCRPQTNKNLLIIEDDEEISSYLEHELSKEYRIITASNGKEGLDKAFKKAPDLIISDVMMPGINGMELCRTIKQNITLNHIPVILLTAKIGEASNIEGLECGADAYITKPFNMEVLRRIISNTINSRQLLKNIYSGSQKPHVEKLDDTGIQSPDERLMERVMKTLNKHLSDSDITIEEIAEEIGISRAHLHRKLKELTNQSPRNFIRNVRLQHAASLLSEKKHSISEVAYITGFSSPAQFATAFKNLYGKTPTEYRDEDR